MQHCLKWASTPAEPSTVSLVTYNTERYTWQIFLCANNRIWRYSLPLTFVVPTYDCDNSKCLAAMTSNSEQHSPTHMHAQMHVCTHTHTHTHTHTQTQTWSLSVKSRLFMLPAAERNKEQASWKISNNCVSLNDDAIFLCFVRDRLASDWNQIKSITNDCQ